MSLRTLECLWLRTEVGRCGARSPPLPRETGETVCGTPSLLRALRSEWSLPSGPGVTSQTRSSLLELITSPPLCCSEVPRAAGDRWRAVAKRGRENNKAVASLTVTSSLPVTSAHRFYRENRMAMTQSTAGSCVLCERFKECVCVCVSLTVRAEWETCIPRPARLWTTSARQSQNWGWMRQRLVLENTF